MKKIINLTKEDSRSVKELIASAIAAPLFVLFLTRFLCGIMYDTNDDRFIAGLISGEITGKASVVEYCNYLLTGPLSLVCRLIPGAPVWGIFLLLVFVVSDAILVFSFSRILKNTALSSISCVILNMSMLFMFSEINYTGIAILAAMAGYAMVTVSFLSGSEKDEKTGLVIFFLAELLAICIRKESMLVVQPFGLTLFGTVLLTEHLDKENDNGSVMINETVPAVGKVLAAILFSTVLFFAGDALGGKNTESYKEYHHFNNLRTAYTDYIEGSVTYEDVAPALEGMGITENKWNAMTEYTAFDWDEDVETYDRIESFLYDRLDHPDAAGIVSGIFENTFLLHSFWLVLLLWVIAFALSLVKGKRRYMIPVITMLIPHFLAWGYIVYMGRIQKRVQYPLFLCEEIALALIIFTVIRSYGGLEEFLQNRIRKYAFAAALSVACAGCFMIAQGQYEECVKANDAKKSLVRGIQETAAYCSDHPDKQYILDINAFGHYFGGPLTTGFYEPSNYTISGSWFSMMPSHADRMNEIIKSDKGFCYIVMDYGDGPEEGRIKGYSATYLKEVTGREPELEDSFDTSFGSRFLVYRF